MVKLFGSLLILWIIILAVMFEGREAGPGKRSQFAVDVGIDSKSPGAARNVLSDQVPNAL